MGINQIFFAVKTWSKYHEDRVPVIQRTWAKETKHIRYYSDVTGRLLPFPIFFFHLFLLAKFLIACNLKIILTPKNV